MKYLGGCFCKSAPLRNAAHRLSFNQGGCNASLDCQRAHHTDGDDIVIGHQGGGELRTRSDDLTKIVVAVAAVVASAVYLIIGQGKPKLCERLPVSQCAFAPAADVLRRVHIANVCMTHVYQIFYRLKRAHLVVDGDGGNVPCGEIVVNGDIRNGQPRKMRDVLVQHFGRHNQHALRAGLVDGVNLRIQIASAVQRLQQNVEAVFLCLFFHAFRQQIADRLGISRVSVSRMLAAGKEMGIVLIQVISPDNLAYSQLEQKLEQLFGLKEAVVVENSPLNTKYDHATSLGTKTIKLLETYLHDGDIVGVSMGQTLYTVCHSSCVDTEAIACTFVPVIGGVSSGGNHSVNVHANQIAMGFAKLFKSEYFEFFAPAMFSDKAIMEGFMRERMMKRILQYYGDCCVKKEHTHI